MARRRQSSNWQGLPMGTGPSAYYKLFPLPSERSPKMHCRGERNRKARIRLYRGSALRLPPETFIQNIIHIQIESIIAQLAARARVDHAVRRQVEAGLFGDAQRGKCRDGLTGNVALMFPPDENVRLLQAECALVEIVVEQQIRHGVGNIAPPPAVCVAKFLIRVAHDHRKILSNAASYI